MVRLLGVGPRLAESPPDSLATQGPIRPQPHSVPLHFAWPCPAVVAHRAVVGWKCEITQGWRIMIGWHVSTFDMVKNLDGHTAEYSPPYQFFPIVSLSQSS